MMNDSKWFNDLLRAKQDGQLDANYLDAFYSRWLQNRVQWQLLHRGVKHASGKYHVPSLAGLYFWGSDQTVDGNKSLVPRYLGRTSSSLRTRMARYVPGPQGPRQGTEIRPQLTMAKEYQSDIRKAVGKLSNECYREHLAQVIQAGLEVLEKCVPGLREAYKRKYERSDEARLKGIVDFALHGEPDLTGIWVAFLLAPIDQINQIESLETALRRAARQWNKDKGLPDLLSRH